MSQAKTLTASEIEQVLAYISTRRFALRNRVMFLMGLWSGVRVASIANLLVGDVLNDDGTVKAEVRLRGTQIKGGKPQTVFLPQKLQVELQRYMDIRRVTDMTHPLFVTAGAKAFSPNVLAQHFFWLFKRCQIAGASSHSLRRSMITTLANSTLLGCCNCGKTYTPSSIVDDLVAQEWSGEGFIFCPHCEIDLVISDNGTGEIDSQLLVEMRNHYFVQPSDFDDLLNPKA